MSTFLGFESFLVPINSTNTNVQDTFKNALSSYGWQILRQNILPAATLGTMTNAANALNNTQADNAGDTAALPRWVGVQMTTAFTPTVMYLQGAVDANTTAPLTFTLDWSDDGSTWTVHQTWAAETFWGSYERRKYTITAAPTKNYWRINVTARQSGGTTYIATWILEDSAKNWITSTSFFDAMPPVTETIGNSYTKEYVRFAFASNLIYVRPMQELLTALPPFYYFDTPTAGAVTLSVTINGVTVSYVGSAPNSAFQNARGLYEALRASADANFLAWNWSWENTLGNTFGVGYIRAVKKVAGPPAVITSSNITTRLRGLYTQPQPQLAGDSPLGWYTINMDTTNGFIYYLQVTSRGLAIATKTSGGFYGPIHACYGDNATAIAQTPQSSIPEIPCTPIELIVGTDDIAANNTATGRLSHFWGVASGLGSWIFQGDTFQASGLPQGANMWTQHVCMGHLQDWSSGTLNNNYTSSHYGTATWTLYPSGLFNGADSGNLYTIHRMSLRQSVNWLYIRYSDAYCRGACPSYDSLDWYKYTGSLADEQLVFAPSSDFVTTLTSSVNTTDVTINVTSTAGWPTAGYIFIGNEVIQYTGVTSTTFTGLTRARYATVAENFTSGEQVNIGCWLVKINTGLLFAGYVKPT